MQSSLSTQQSHTSIDLPRLGAPVMTPCGAGVFQGAAYVLRRGTTEIESLTADIRLNSGKRAFIDMDEVEVL